MKDTDTIKTVVESAELPDYVKECRLEFDTDSDGGPSVLIYVIVSDKEAKTHDFTKHAREIRKILFDKVMETGVDRWPYIRFRSVREQRQLDKEEQVEEGQE